MSRSEWIAGGICLAIVSALLYVEVTKRLAFAAGMQVVANHQIIPPPILPPFTKEAY